MTSTCLLAYVCIFRMYACIYRKVFLTLTDCALFPSKLQNWSGSHSEETRLPYFVPSLHAGKYCTHVSKRGNCKRHKQLNLQLNETVLGASVFLSFLDVKFIPALK
jgi:hypothetical protein